MTSRLAQTIANTPFWGAQIALGTSAVYAVINCSPPVLLQREFSFRPLLAGAILMVTATVLFSSACYWFCNRQPILAIGIMASAGASSGYVASMVWPNIGYAQRNVYAYEVTGNLTKANAWNGVANDVQQVAIFAIVGSIAAVAAIFVVWINFTRRRRAARS
jgi:hypothetical protein